MNIDELTNRINFLYSKSNSIGLTENELLEQKKLRRKYIDNVKNNLKAQLNNVNNNSDSMKLN